MDLGKKFQNLCCGKNDDVHAHLEKLADLCKRLSLIRCMTDNAEYTLVILGSLSLSFDPAVDSLTNLYEATNKDLTPTAVIQMAINEQEKCLLCKGKDMTEEEAFTAKVSRAY